MRNTRFARPPIHPSPVLYSPKCKPMMTRKENQNSCLTMKSQSVFIVFLSYPPNSNRSRSPRTSLNTVREIPNSSRTTMSRSSRDKCANDLSSSTTLLATYYVYQDSAVKFWLTVNATIQRVKGALSMWACDNGNLSGGARQWRWQQVNTEVFRTLCTLIRKNDECNC